jgi:hypothetical protein
MTSMIMKSGSKKEFKKGKPYSTARMKMSFNSTCLRVVKPRP